MEEAAALWMAYSTAYGGLIDIAGLSEGDAVVISAASSSVGLAAIQIANMAGATPIALARTRGKRDLLLRAEAAQEVASGEGDVAARLDEITGVCAGATRSSIPSPALLAELASATAGTPRWSSTACSAPTRPRNWC